MTLLQNFAPGVPTLLDFLGIADVDDSNEGKRITIQQAIELYNTFTAIMTNKTLTTPTLNNPTFLDAAQDHTYQVAVADLLGNVNITLPLLVGSDIFVFEAHAQSLTNKIIDDESNTVIADATHIYVRNQSGGAMAKGDVIYVSGYNIGADKPEISLADASAQSTMPSVGLVFDAALPNGSNGVVCVTGRMQNLDTSSFAAGDELYVSETPGEFTNVKPTGTALIQKIGTVLRSHATLGIVEIGYQFADHVDIQTAQTVTGVKTMTSPVLVTPTIASFTNAQHNHENAAAGGVLAKAAIPTTTVYEDEANSWGTSNQNISATGKWQEAGINISPIGLHDIWMGPGAAVPITAGGVASRIVGTGDNRKGLTYIPYTNGVNEFATFQVTLPRNFDNGTITVVIKWIAETEGAGDVIWGVAAVAASDGDDLAGAGTNYGTEIIVTDTQTTINFEQFAPRTAAITIANTPVDSDTLFIRVQRRGADGGDTFTQPAQLTGIYYDITTDAPVSA